MEDIRCSTQLLPRDLLPYSYHLTSACGAQCRLHSLHKQSNEQEKDTRRLRYDGESHVRPPTITEHTTNVYTLLIGKPIRFAKNPPIALPKAPVGTIKFTGFPTKHRRNNAP